VILFFTPDVHLRELKNVWADDIIIEEVWRNFMQKLISEWIEFVLYVSFVSLLDFHYFDLTKSTVNCDARGKCRVSCHSRRRRHPIKGMDDSFYSGCKLHFIGV
jgi:hypothetical protein